MTLSAAELKIQKANTKAFIAANPTALVLIPRTRTNGGGGNKWQDSPPRASQTFRIIDQTRTFGPQPGTVLTSDGQQRKVIYQLLGEADTTIGLYDYWVDGQGIRWEVSDLVPFNQYERRAMVTRYGEG